MPQRKENQGKEYKPRPNACGPRPHTMGLRPERWTTGPDQVRHAQYTAWMKAKAQANFRGEGWTLTFEEFEFLWNQDASWAQRGRGADDLMMTRLDSSQPWSKTNCYILLRRTGLIHHAEKLRGRPRGKYKKKDLK